MGRKKRRSRRKQVPGATGKKPPGIYFPPEIGMATHDQGGAYRSRYLPVKFPRGMTINMRIQFRFIGDPREKKVDADSIELVKPGGKVQTIPPEMLGVNQRDILLPVIRQILEGASLKGSLIKLKHPSA